MHVCDLGTVPVGTRAGNGADQYRSKRHIQAHLTRTLNKVLASVMMSRFHVIHDRPLTFLSTSTSPKYNLISSVWFWVYTSGRDGKRRGAFFERLKRDRVIRLLVTDPRTRRTAREKADKLSVSYKRARAVFFLFVNWRDDE